MYFSRILWKLRKYWRQSAFQTIFSKCLKKCNQMAASLIFLMIYIEENINLPVIGTHDTDVKLMLELKQKKLHFSQEPIFVVVRHLHVILSIKEEWNHILFL